MTTTDDRPTTLARPSWATFEYLDARGHGYEREMSVSDNEGANWPVTLHRFDRDGEPGTPEILFGPDLQGLQIDEARRYAAALVEQCDRADRS